MERQSVTRGEEIQNTVEVKIRGRERGREGDGKTVCDKR